MALVWRLAVIGFGYLVAGLVAGGFVTVAALYPQFSELYLEFHDRYYVAIHIGGLFISGFALLPAMVLTLIAESFSFRSLLFYAFSGAVVGLAIYLSLNAFDPEGMRIVIADRRELEIVIGGGVLGGLVYWLIAGRNAGRWRRRAEL